MSLKHDLLLTRGHVIDPSQDIDGVCDVGIRDGKITAVGPGLDSSEATETLDVQGKYVCPGLIDLHGHWYEGSAFGIDPHMCLNTGVTTAVDAGTTGFINFPDFRRRTIDTADVQILAFVHVSCLGIPSILLGELEDARYARPVETASMIEKHRDVTVGVKIRVGIPSGKNGLELVDSALSAARSANVPLMIHASDHTETPKVLDKMGPGDILTHCYKDRSNGPCIITAEGRLRKETIAARKRGVVFDVGHGRGSFSWETALRAFEESFYPDTLSTDLHRYCVEGPVYDMPTTMSKFFCLGMSLQEIILKTTWAPAQSIRRESDIGTLKPGTTADVFVFEIETGEFEFEDVFYEKKKGDERVSPFLTIKSGKPVRPGAYDVQLREFEFCDREFAAVPKKKGR